MENTTQADLSVVASKLNLPVDKVQAAVELIDQGNTIPFITRYRKDEIGGIAERALRSIKSEVTRLRNLQERKAIILKSIENQGKLDDSLKEKIEQASQSRQLEDLYLPFKPKKQTLASVARQQGLEPLARDVLDGANPDVDLATRAMDFVRVDKGLEGIDDVYKGVQHLLAERFSEHVELRRNLRDVFLRSGTLSCSLVEDSKSKKSTDAPAAAEPDSKHDEGSGSSQDGNPSAGSQQPAVTPTTSEPIEGQENSSVAESDGAPVEGDDQTSPLAKNEVDATEPPNPAESDAPSNGEPNANTEHAGVEPGVEQNTETVTESSAESGTAAGGGDLSAGANIAVAESPPKTATKSKKKKKKKKKPDPFEEFANFQESIHKIPPHRVLAINRGERAGRLKCRLTTSQSDINDLAKQFLYEQDHPFADFLWQAAEQALARSILPSIEREIRREITEKAETHAVGVFARNLRHLLLQPPVTGHRILAIDPGFKSGCKAAAIDERGNPLGHCVFPIVGNRQRREDGKQALINLVREHQLTLIAIGNGNGCRATEQFVSDLIANELVDLELQYAIVNQAGASVYSTSEIGREELPDYEPVIRSAISIGRRLLDPLSELVKINPANIGVGMYQHDVKAKHLAESLEQEVESCVNYVGVNVNTASAMLLRFVSGLGQLTARRLVEHCKENGAFQHREQLKQVPGFGQVTFVQAAGFLRVPESPHLLDRTSIHPESYHIAEKIVEQIGGTIEELFVPAPLPASRETSNEAPTAVSEAKGANDQPVDTSETDTRKETGTNEEHEKRKQRRFELHQKLKALDVPELARQFSVGEITVRDILRALKRPQRDPREDLPLPIFRKGIIKIEDLKPQMQLRGQVVNVVDFGVFVDIGIGESCLIHISRLSNRFVRDPHWLFSVGDVINIWVQEIDKANRRVTLTAVRPDFAKPPRKFEKRRDSSKPGSSRFKQKGRGKTRQSSAASAKRKSRPKPVRPLTQAMAEGKEPMRSFSDLLQFHKKKNDQDDKESS